LRLRKSRSVRQVGKLLPLRRGAAGQVLARVEEANQLGRLLPPEAFYNELIRRAAGSGLGRRARSARRQPRAAPAPAARLARADAPLTPRPESNAR